jgi:hypothetical protein
MKLIIAGSRNFGHNFLENGDMDIQKNAEQYSLLCNEVSKFIGNEENVTVVSGLARGADMLGCDYATENGYPIEGFRAEWDKFGRSAGIRRNKYMAKNADALIAFWDGESRGTQHMIDYAHERGLRVKVVMYGSL